MRTEWTATLVPPRSFSSVAQVTCAGRTKDEAKLAACVEMAKALSIGGDEGAVPMAADELLGDAKKVQFKALKNLAPT